MKVVKNGKIYRDENGMMRHPGRLLYDGIPGPVIARGQEAERYPAVKLFTKEPFILTVHNASAVRDALLANGFVSRIPAAGYNPAPAANEMGKQITAESFLDEVRALDEIGVALDGEDRILPYYCRVSGTPLPSRWPN